VPLRTVVLAIESATSTPSVALLAGAEVLALRSAPPGAVAAEVILPAVEAVLAEAQLALGEVALFALAIGPGSFTGLRVGLATVKGLAFRSDRPVAPVPTLAALCFGAGSVQGAVAALLDARRGEVYAAAHGPGSQGLGEEVLVPEGLYTPAALTALLPAGCRCCGDGAVLYAPALAAAGLAIAPDAAHACAAPAVGRLGLRWLERGLARPAAELVPRYLRRAEAEARRTGEALEDKKLF
jgi:tRNA threonylcarbamoyladenosine biosynthesis protein TsaB